MQPDYTSLDEPQLLALDTGYRDSFAAGQSTPNDINHHMARLTEAAYQSGIHRFFELLSHWTVQQDNEKHDRHVVTGALYLTLHTRFWTSAIKVFRRTIERTNGWDAAKFLVSGECLVYPYAGFAQFNIPDELNKTLNGKRPWVPMNKRRSVFMDFIVGYVTDWSRREGGGWEPLPVGPNSVALAVDDVGPHQNVLRLITRMENAIDVNDPTAALHASASVFETLAKDVVGLPTVSNKTLKSFFDRYRKESSLPPKLLDYILSVYDARNVTPLAGHGSLAAPAFTQDQAVALAEMTKALVRTEYRLSALPRQ